MAFNNLIERITTVLDKESTLEGLVRHLLEMLELVTQMESTYLTRVEPDGSLQHVLFSRNSKTMQIPEGLSVIWKDTLCRRALHENRPFTNEVPAIWGDSDAAKALGIVTYASTPVTLSDGSLYGTLCAASSSRRDLTDNSAQVLQLFSQLIAQQIQSEQALRELQEAHDALQAASYTDELTRLPNRRAVFSQLNRLFTYSRENHKYVLMIFVDLDGFKNINDQYGHETGDEFLCAIARRLDSHIRSDEILGRLGGDEFIIAGEGPDDFQQAQQAALTLKQRIKDLLTDEFGLTRCVIHYAGPSIGALALSPQNATPDSAIGDADALMYIDKHQRKSNPHLPQTTFIPR